MSNTAGDPYEFPGLPIDAVEPGTNLLVSGPQLGGARDLLLGMLVGPPPEGVLVVAADVGAATVADAFERVGGEVDAETVRVIDCSGEEATILGDAVRCVGSPADLTGIGMAFSRCYESLYASGRKRVRTGVYTLAPLLVYADDPRSVFRFLHTANGRIRAADGLGVCGVDPASHDERTVKTITQVFDGKIDLRETGGSTEIRIRGVADQPEGWQHLDLDSHLESAD